MTHSSDTIIPYGCHLIDDGDINAVVEVLRGDWLTQGPMVSEFETALASYCGSKHAVAVANGTVALHLACLAAGVTKESEGITSPLTFAASANCLLYCGGKPVFCDIDSQTWNMDPQKLSSKITAKTKVIIPVYFAGLPCDMDRINEIAKQSDITVIADACHALGAMYKGKPIGALADMTCLSFHPVKHITTGEGGAILTDNDEFAKKLRKLRHHGITKDPEEMNQNDGPWYYEINELGMNGRITDMQCALGLSQLSRQDQFLQRRLEIAKQYHEQLSAIEGIRFQVSKESYMNAYHLFVAHFDPNLYDRKKIYNYLFEQNIRCQIHYVPLHKQPLYKQFVTEEYPNADYYYQGCISLPMYPGLTEKLQDRVIEAIKAILTH